MKAITPASSRPGKRDSADSGSLPQCGQSLGQRMRTRELRVTIRAHDQERQVCRVAHHITQQLEAGLVRPLEIVQHEDDCLVLRNLTKQSDHRPVQEIALGFGVRGSGRGQVPKPLSKGRDDLGEFRTQGLNMCVQGFFGCMGDIVRQGLDERPVRGAEILITAAQKAQWRLHQTPSAQPEQQEWSCRLPPHRRSGRSRVPHLLPPV